MWVRNIIIQMFAKGESLNLYQIAQSLVELERKDFRIEILMG